MSILEVPAADYHDDEVGLDVPSLSRSIAHIICSKTPAHARLAHPKLSPTPVAREEDTKFDTGTAAHALLMEGDANVEVVYEKDWKKKTTQEARDAARLAGKTPLLEHQWHEVQAMVAALRVNIEPFELDPPAFTDGKAEVTVTGVIGGAAARARLDWFHDQVPLIDDYKTAVNANAEKWSRGPLFDHGLDIQWALYTRLAERLVGVRPRFRWIVQEKTRPYLVTVVEPSADVRAVGDAKLDYAIRVWKRCLDTGVWPGYPSRVHQAELPPWADDARWLVDEVTA